MSSLLPSFLIPPPPLRSGPQAQLTALHLGNMSDMSCRRRQEGTMAPTSPYLNLLLINEEYCLDYGTIDTKQNIGTVDDDRK